VEVRKALDSEFSMMYAISSVVRRELIAVYTRPA
jgi:hypothetical protein